MIATMHNIKIHIFACPQPGARLAQKRPVVQAQ